MERRNLMGGGLAAGLGALVATAAAAPEAAAAQRDDGERVARAIDNLRGTFQGQFETALLAPNRAMRAIRRQQREWVRATHKYPDFIEVGLDVWDGLHDWHVQHQQPLAMTRRPDGRYMMSFMFTTVILRSDQAPDYVGYPFDADGTRRQ